MSDGDNFLNQHLEYIGKYLYGTLGTYTHWTQAALEAAHGKAADAKLLAIRSSSYSSENAPSQWMYLFYSLNRAYAYTVFVSDGQATAADSGPMSISPQDFDAIPDASAITIDADDAWNAIVESMDGDGEICTARVFLMTYVKGDDDPTHDAMKWFFLAERERQLGIAVRQRAGQARQCARALVCGRLHERFGGRA